MNEARFEKLVEEALDSLPEEFASRLENVAVLVEDQPTPAQLKKMHVGAGHLLLGLYEGINRIRRADGYAGALPDRITIFRIPIEKVCTSDGEIRRQVRQTVMHELGHYFGMSEERLRRDGAE